MKNLKIFLLLTAMAIAPAIFAKDADSTTKTVVNIKAGGLQLPEGFSAAVIMQGMDGARHLAITPQGGIYVKLSRLKDGKGIYYLKDNDGDGIIDETTGFGDYPGTGICIKNNYLYASSNDDVFRYTLNAKGEVTNPSQPDKIITGLVNHNRDNSKSITVDNKNNIYVNIGSYSNSCLLSDTARQAPNPCPLLDSVGGIWMFKTNQLNQGYKEGVHYATGFKNVVGLDWNTTTKSLFIMQHGRDVLHDLYPQLFTVEQNNLLPAETMYELHKGSSGGWPYVYYDQQQHKKILAPEYGGNGTIEGGSNAQDPVVAFPAHLAPNGLVFYTGKQFPAKYQQGAFIAFHGKSPELQKGYLVAFVPFKGHTPTAEWEIFADGFAGDKGQPKPCGLAQGPDGSLYVADDATGNIYKITYKK
ncbi:PQQ-dependent sugar dehydrogenase [Limnovirga soli]|uniref:Sorbosone dehydrogenase n=1 Tax=Limnovirga soli TaxID=2656915 RepID=A0A8J8FCD3_9BACT|nr:PQQ-dependent sugar dehydrogenase [Limnovirga soli]NNV55408.1 sorbosone dehydrogenase [Limnovirga soli]